MLRPGGRDHHRHPAGRDWLGRAGHRARAAWPCPPRLRHTAPTWMADAGVDLRILQRVAGHQDPAVTARYLHPDVQAMLDAGTTFSAWWSVVGRRSASSMAVRMPAECRSD